MIRKIDWRNHGYVTDVKYQDKCQSCWAFSAVGALEGQVAKLTGQLVSLSEQNLIDCSQIEGNLGCKGGTINRAFRYVQNNNGINYNSVYPYKGIVSFLLPTSNKLNMSCFYIRTKTVNINQKVLQQSLILV